MPASEHSTAELLQKKAAVDDLAFWLAAFVHKTRTMGLLDNPFFHGARELKILYLAEIRGPQYRHPKYCDPCHGDPREIPPFDHYALQNPICSDTEPRSIDLIFVRMRYWRDMSIVLDLSVHTET